jgi:hypothetical protein
VRASRLWDELVSTYGYRATPEAGLGVQMGRHGRGNGKEDWKIGRQSSGKLAAFTHDGPQLAWGKSRSHPRQIIPVLTAAGWQRKQNEDDIGGGGEPAFERRIPMLHHKHARPGRQSNFWELDSQVPRQVVSGMPISQKMRIEADDHGFPGGCNLR